MVTRPESPPLHQLLLLPSEQAARAQEDGEEKPMLSRSFSVAKLPHTSSARNEEGERWQRAGSCFYQYAEQTSLCKHSEERGIINFFNKGLESIGSLILNGQGFGNLVFFFPSPLIKRQTGL